MQKLNLPEFDLIVREKDVKDEILDIIRKKYIRLTPEEWVRQNFIAYLLQEKNYPQSLMAIEKEIIIDRQKRRPDIVVFKNDMKPVLAVECKAPAVKISQDTFDQLIRYNSIMKVKYLITTNGMKHYCCRIDYEKNVYRYLQEVPAFSEL